MSYREESYMDRERDRSPRRDRDRDASPKHDKDRSYSRSPSRDRDRRRRTSRSRHYTGSRENPKPSRCLGVFGLSIHTTEDELYHLFSKYGRVERVQVVLDAKTSRSRGFAFVYFESSDDAKVAKDQCTGMKISGKNIRVDFSITERAHTPTPGIYMGKPSYRSYDRHDRSSRRDDYRDRDRERSSRYNRRSPSPYYSGRSRRRYSRSRSRSYSPRRY